MKILNILLTVSSLILSAVCQRVEQQRLESYEPNINSDQVYFSENRPVGLLTQQNARVRHQVKSKLQGVGNERQVLTNVEHPTTTTDSYLQGISGNVGQSSYLNQAIAQENVNPNYSDRNYGQELLKQPNTDLEPPRIDANNRNYYDDSVQNNKRISSFAPRQDVIDAVPQVPTQNQMQQYDNISFAITNFGINLVKNNDQSHGGNVIVSPYSIATLVALLQQGALGETQLEISRALQMTPEVAANTYKRLTEDVTKRTISRNILQVATNLFVADAFTLNREFKRTAIRNFGSDVTPTKFLNPEEAVRKINTWVAIKTLNKIDKLVTSEIINDNTQLVLANAVYFKGLWQMMFNPELTLPREFHLSNGRTKAAPFMRARRFFKTGVDRTNNAQVIVLPFEGDQYSLVVILPSEVSSLDAVVSTLSAAQMTDYQKFSPKEVQLELPRFTIRGDLNLNPILRQMGITKVFGPQSELSGIGTYQNLSPQVSSAVHTAMLSIDEQGGSAAAATAFAVVALSYDDPSIVFNANRPFLAVIWDNKLALPLFIARIEDPTS